MKLKDMIRLWADQLLIASFWAFVISIVIARTYLSTPEAFKTTLSVLISVFPLISMISIPVAVLRILNRKRKQLGNTDPGPDWKYIGPDRRKITHTDAPPVKGQSLRIVECAECFEKFASTECLGH